MGKKKGRKKKKQKKYNKKQFKQAICSGCGLCPTGVDPKFCYAHYKDSGPLFVAEALPKLVQARYWFADTQLSKDMFDTDRFEETFCDVCDGGLGRYNIQCTYFAGCYMEFREQLFGKGIKQPKRKKKKKGRYIAEPYPTFFHSPGEWVDELLKEVMDDFGPDNCGNMEATVVQCDESGSNG